MKRKKRRDLIFKSSDDVLEEFIRIINFSVPRSVKQIECDLFFAQRRDKIKKILRNRAIKELEKSQ